VNLVTTVYERFRQLIHEGAKFCVIGGIGAIVTLGGADILHNHLQVDKYVALTIATLLATVVTFVGNRYWTFRHRSGRGTTHESAMFFVLNGVGLLIGYACIWLVQSAFGLSGALWYDFANFLGLVFGTLFRFWSYRKWVWHAGPAAEVLPETGFAQPAPAFSGAYLDDATVNLGLGPNGHESREPELVPPPWNSGSSAVPQPGPAASQHWDGPGYSL
jgi:putative flippase GtrA